MDLPDVDPLELSKTLDYLSFVNSVLGGDHLLLKGLTEIMQRSPEKRLWRILDIGCGRGDQLQIIQKWAQKQPGVIVISGLDNNPENIRLARKNSTLQNVTFYCSDALSEDFGYEQFDIVCCTLFLHHLSDFEAEQLLRLLNKSKTKVLINDLHRSPVAWFLFKCFALITAAPRIARHDGAMSVRNAFKKQDLVDLSKKSGFKNLSVNWKWAFRYQVLLDHDEYAG